MRISLPSPGTVHGSRGRRIFFLLIVLLVATVAAEAAAQNLSTGHGRVRGRIEDPDGNQVPNAKITFTYTNNGDVYEAEGGDNGIFVKGNLGFGVWRVQITAPGFKNFVYALNLRDLGRDYPLEVIMEPGSSEPIGGGGTELTSLFTGELGDRLNEVGELFDAGDYAGALAGYEGLIMAEAAKDTPNPEIHYVHLNAGNAAFEVADYAKAAMHYSALIEEVPDNVDGRLGLAKAYMAERKFDEAMAALEGLDLSSVMDPIVFYNIGSVLFDQGQSADAATYYQLAVERDPGFADAYMQLGLCFIQQGKMTEAKPHLEKVIALDPGSENAALAQEFLALVEG